MAKTYTPNLNLEKDDGNEFYDVGVHGRNMDKIDAVIVSKTTAALTYYVRTDGNDNNTGLADTAGGAFRTIQKALNSVPKYLAHNVTINVGAGTYNENVTIHGFGGEASLSIFGDTVTPTNVKTTTFTVRNCTTYVGIKGFDITTTTADAVVVSRSVYVEVTNGRITGAASGFKGVVSFYGSNTFVSQMVISNKGIALDAYQGQMTSWDNSGTGNTTGVNASLGGSLSKVGTQPTGTTQETAVSGGIITGGGVPFTQSNYGFITTKAASFTLALTDANSVCYMTGGSAQTVTIPTNASVPLPVGTQITFIQYSGQNVTFAPSGGVTLVSKDNKRTIDGLYASATLIQIAGNTWVLVGALKA